MKRFLNSLVMLFTIAAFHQSASAQITLHVGDKAPPLSIKEWVNGDAVNLSRDASNKIHLVEFWATWCPPCKASIPLLTKYQNKYKNDLTIIGVTDPDGRGNTIKAIRRFVKKRSKEMTYTVAIDDNSKTANRYLLAAGAIGIPHSFLVGRDGNILWQGSPLDPQLGEILPKVIDGSYDLSAAKVEQEVMKRLQALSLSIQMGQWATVWDGLIDILKIDPTNEVAMDALVNIYAQELRNTKSFRTWTRTYIDINKSNPKAMTQLAGKLLQINDFTTSVPDLALEAAKNAYHSTNKRDAMAMTTYARALYHIGHLDRAITLQEEAVAIASSEISRDARSALKYYQLCKQLRESTEQ